MYFHKYCNKSNIYLTDKETKREILDDMLNGLDMEEGLKTNIHNAIMYREGLMSTGIGLGVAIPHARISEISNITISVSVLKYPCKDYESIDSKPVHVIFMILIPEGMHGEYISILSAIVYQIKNKNLISDIMDATSIEDVYRRLEQI